MEMDNQEAGLLRIYIDESDLIEGRSAYKEIVHYFKRNGFSGATVIRCIYGYGKKNQLHSASILRLSTDLPILIEVVDSRDKIQAALPEVKNMIKEGLITLEKISIIKHEGYK
jgi:PII-like signaling protein